VRVCRGGVWRWNYSTSAPACPRALSDATARCARGFAPSCFVSVPALPVLVGSGRVGSGQEESGGISHEPIVGSALSTGSECSRLVFAHINTVIQSSSIIERLNAQQIVTARRTALHFCLGMAWLGLAQAVLWAWGLVSRGLRLAWPLRLRVAGSLRRPGHSLPIKGSRTRTAPRTSRLFRFCSVLILAN
jgi:hypothetical protein